jgi:Flp pilus assembly pilin Flp
VTGYWVPFHPCKFNDIWQDAFICSNWSHGALVTFRFFSTLLRHEDGATAIGYGLIAALITLAAIMGTLVGTSITVAANL